MSEAYDILEDEQDLEALKLHVDYCLGINDEVLKDHNPIIAEIHQKVEILFNRSAQ